MPRKLFYPRRAFTWPVLVVLLSVLAGLLAILVLSAAHTRGKALRATAVAQPAISSPCAILMSSAADSDPLRGLAICVQNTGEILPLVRSPRVISPSPSSPPNTAGASSFGLEDTPPPVTCMDFQDLQMKVNINPDGTAMITVIANSAAWDFDLVNRNTRVPIVVGFKPVNTAYIVPPGNAPIP